MAAFFEIFESTVGIETEVELVAPAEFVTCFTEGIITDLCSRVTLCQVGSMGCYLICDNTYTYIFAIRQAEVLFRRYVAEHGSTEPTDLCSSDSGSDMVVTRCDIGNEWTEGIERSIMAFLYLAFHILFDFMERHMTGTFDKCLYVILPSALYEFAESIEFSKLSFVIGIIN